MKWKLGVVKGFVYRDLQVLGFRVRKGRTYGYVSVMEKDIMTTAIACRFQGSPCTTLCNNRCTPICYGPP